MGSKDQGVPLHFNQTGMAGKVPGTLIRVSFQNNASTKESAFVCVCVCVCVCMHAQALGLSDSS